MDPLGHGDSEAADSFPDHPDLVALGRRLQIEMDETLRAEQHAARIAAQRRSTIRDRLLLAEDRAETIEIELVAGTQIRGAVLAVGADHVVLACNGRQCWIAIHHLATLQAPRR